MPPVLKLSANEQVFIRPGLPPLDHVQEDKDVWCFFEGLNPETSERVLEVPKSLGPDLPAARAVAVFATSLAGTAYTVGLLQGRAEAQRFFRLAIGIETPTIEERVDWRNPVPLKESQDVL